MRAVNLLPDQGRDQGPQVMTSTAVAVGGSVVLVLTTLVLAVSLVQARGTVSDKQETLDALRAQVVKVEAATVRSAEQRNTDRARVTAFTDAAAIRVAWDDLLDDVARVLPSGAWLTDMTMQAGTAPDAAATTTDGTTPAVAPTPTAFVVSGVSLTQNTVAQIMQRLELVPALSNVTLQQSTRTTVGEQKAFQFTMSADVRAPEVPR